MSYFAHVVDGVVQQVIVAEQDFVDNLKKAENGLWIETFQDGSQRKHYAGVGFTYDAKQDVFIPPLPFDSWVLDEESMTWNPPISHPGDGAYAWDEQAVSWIKLEE